MDPDNDSIPDLQNEFDDHIKEAQRLDKAAI